MDDVQLLLDNQLIIIDLLNSISTTTQTLCTFVLVFIGFVCAFWVVDKLLDFTKRF